jgi:hypothetical protein
LIEAVESNFVSCFTVLACVSFISTRNFLEDIETIQKKKKMESKFNACQIPPLFHILCFRFCSRKNLRILSLHIMGCVCGGREEIDMESDEKKEG